ncbi:dTMP kinase [Arcanobacterium wilhelmae]|uniref:Thymidylate kinase n=1 Tax=Arcanobacterium wilhelmae TaxID=1803177 RepID=A0ABT9NBK6_9ACTO|nr:dTMP kinase [Arcanobacterium wilhelmae]MDP9801097.1 dTMP kinase [Arcanobacterium wilhelmae]
MGLFITFEGGDGSGKTTQIAAIKVALESRGLEVLTSREPGGTELGAKIRQLLLFGGEVAPRAEALLYAADRAQNIATRVRPALERGAIVLEDRYIDSSVAYQGGARSLGAEEIRELSMWATDRLTPDLTLLFDVPTDVGAQRVGGEKDRLEAEGLAFHESVRRAYLEMAAGEPERFRVIDAAAPIEQVTAAALAAIEPLLERAR